MCVCLSPCTIDNSTHDADSVVDIAFGAVDIDVIIGRFSSLLSSVLLDRYWCSYCGEYQGAVSVSWRKVECVRARGECQCEGSLSG